MTIQAFMSFARWLQASPLSLWMRAVVTTSSWLAPTVETLHILAIATVVGSVGVLNLRLLGVAGRGHALQALARRFTPLIWVALIVLLATGSVLVVGRPTRYFGNWAFLVKMALILLAIGWTLAFQLSVKRNECFWEMSARRRTAAKFVGFGSLLLWTGVIFAGRWIAYV